MILFSVVFAFPLYGRGRAVFVWSVGKNIADGWRKLGTVDFTSFFRAYTGYSRQFSLNDWGNYQLLKYASMQLYPSFSPRERTLFLFYALSNAGYKAKIGRVEKDVLVLLLPFAEEVYKLPFIKAGEEKYYVMDISSKQLKKLYSIMADFPKAEKVLSLHISEALDFPENEIGRKFTGKYPFSLSLNRNLLDFYATFPLCDLSVYFSAEPSKTFTNSMDKIVKIHLKGSPDRNRLPGYWILYNRYLSINRMWRCIKRRFIISRKKRLFIRMRIVKIYLYFCHG